MWENFPKFWRHNSCYYDVISCCLIAARSARKFWALFHRFYTGKHDFVAFWVLRFRLKSRFDRDFRPKNKLAIWPKILTQIAIWPRFLRGPPHPQGGGTFSHVKWFDRKIALPPINLDGGIPMAPPRFNKGRTNTRCSTCRTLIKQKYH